NILVFVCCSFQIDDCALQLSHNGTYLDLESTVAEQKDEMEGFLEDPGRGKKHSMILRTQLSVRVHACIEKLYNSNGRELRRALFSLKQIFQDDKDLVHEFVVAEGLTCLIKVGAEADQNYQNYILRALGQIMLYVDGMNGVIGHNETIQWLYTLIGSKFRLVVKTALKLLLVFVEYTESNALLLIKAVTIVDKKRGVRSWSNIMEILDEKDGIDTELLVYAMTLINKTSAGLPDQDSFYDVIDCLEEQGMEAIAQRHLSKKGTDLDLVEQFNIYEMTLKHEDGDDNSVAPSGRKERRRSSLGLNERRGLERRRSRRHSVQNKSSVSAPVSPCSPLSGHLSQTASSFLSDCEEGAEEEQPVTEPNTEDEGDEEPSCQLKPDTANKRAEISSQSSKYIANFIPLSEEKGPSSQHYTYPSTSSSSLSQSPSSPSDYQHPSSSFLSPSVATHLSPNSSQLSSANATPAVSPTIEKLPYVPHLPFHLFSYDLSEPPTRVKEKEAEMRENRVQEFMVSESIKISIKEKRALCGDLQCTTSFHCLVHRPALGGLLSSSYRQHQESLAAEREKRRQEREERLQRIESRIYEKEPEPEPEPEPELEPESEAERETEGATETRAAELGPELENEQGPERDAEENALLSEKERQNEEVNEKDNCSASSISSASSTLEREEREDKVTSDNENGQWTQSIKEVSVNDQCSNILNNKRFMLDMLYSQNKKAEDEGEAELNDKEKEEKEESLASLASRISILQANKQACEENVKKMEIDHLENQGSVRAFTEKFNSGEISKGSGSSDSEVAEKAVDKVAAQPKKESDYIWDQLMANPRELKIKDMDFTDLEEEDDVNVLDMECLLSSGDSILPPPPPPPPFMVPGMCLPPAPPIRVPQCPGSPHLTRGEPTFLKKKKTIRLFWNELRPIDWRYKNHKRCKETLWARLEPVKVDISKLEHLFESKSKEIPVTKKSASDGKRQEVIVLDSKRSNAINIGLTVLPPPRTIKTAILNFDEYALNKEGIEKILTMIPTEEEKQKIQEAQLLNPDIPLGTAEQFLLTLSSISELSARLQLWAFKLDYETVEKEVAEPLQDLKEGMDQLENNKSLRYILATLLAIGNFLNASNAKGFELGYLAKVPEVKDTVHKQSLLHHTATIVVEKFPDSSDLYSEIGAITRSAKVDFDQLQENLCQLERRCKASWDHLKAIAKHEMKPVLKQKMSEFLKDCAERIIILKIVHRRIVNRFHAFLLFMGHPPYAIREASIHRFCKIISEFALEYRTTRERVLQQKQKRANHRERNKTRGKMITDTGKFSTNTTNASSSRQPQGLQYAEEAAEHENMKAVLKTSSPSGEVATCVPGTRTRTRANRGRVGSWNPGNDDSPNATDDAADEIMDRIVKSATQVPNQRAVPRERKRSRANRKSLRRTLKSGLTPEEAKALGLVNTSEMQV
uniref:Formin homology 2 domain containing 3 n=1 Tax=Callorhinchus milii TaxID=7868 RepID=A0A4W3JZA5_CALMI